MAQKKSSTKKGSSRSSTLDPEFIKLLGEYVSIRSVSPGGGHETEMSRTVDWLLERFRSSHFTTEVWKSKNANPVVFAEYIVDPSYQTILVYGHYDVQPATDDQGWSSDPFIMTETRDGYIARGVVDNKGQNLIHIFSVTQLIKEGKLGYNVKFVIEGNEETASPDLPGILTKYKKRLACDAVLISDGELPGNFPVIETGLRGGFNIKVHLRTAKMDVHSGIYGGAIPNATHELASLIAGLYDHNNRVTMPGFYDDVDPISAGERKNNQRLERSGNMLGPLGVKHLKAEPKNDFFTQTGLRPTIQVTGIKGGYQGEGFFNIIPSIAEATFNVRTVASQDTKQLMQKFKAYIKETVSPGIAVMFTEGDWGDAVKVSTGGEMYTRAKDIMKRVYKSEVLRRYAGGSIPIVSDMQKIFGVEILLISLANSDSNMHGPDEIFKTSYLKKGLMFSRGFFKKD